MVSVAKTELGWEYNEKAIKVKGTKKELEILEEAVSKNVETPYTYDRLSILLVKEGKKKEAMKVCKKYLKVINWESPRKKAIINRLKRLEGKN